MVWFDTYSAGISLLCSAMFEAIAVTYFYGNTCREGDTDHYFPSLTTNSSTFKVRSGSARTSSWWLVTVRDCIGSSRGTSYLPVFSWYYSYKFFTRLPPQAMHWKLILCVHFQCVIVLSIYNSESLSYYNYDYPVWATVLGWGFTLSSVSAIPIYAAFYFIKQYINKPNKRHLSGNCVDLKDISGEILSPIGRSLDICVHCFAEKTNITIRNDLISNANNSPIFVWFVDSINHYISVVWVQTRCGSSYEWPSVGPMGEPSNRSLRGLLLEKRHIRLKPIARIIGFQVTKENLLILCSPELSGNLEAA